MSGPQIFSPKKTYHLYLQWKFKLWAGKFASDIKAKHSWMMSTNFFFRMCVDNAQQCFAFTPEANFPAHNLNFHWRWRSLESNGGCLLKKRCLYWLSPRNQNPIKGLESTNFWCAYVIYEWYLINKLEFLWAMLCKQICKYSAVF